MALENETVLENLKSQLKEVSEQYEQLATTPVSYTHLTLPTKA